MKNTICIGVVLLVSLTLKAQGWEDTRLSKNDTLLKEIRKIYVEDSTRFISLVDSLVKYMTLDSIHYEIIPPNDQILKEVFLCECIYASFPKDSLYKYDNSTSVYFSLLEDKANSGKIGIIEQIAKEVAKSVSSFGVEYGHVRIPSISYCVYFYHSQILDQIIKAYLSSP